MSHGAYLRRFGLSAVFAWCAGCAGEKSGLPYDRLRIAVTRADAASASGFPRCVTLPVLNGSVVEQRHVIEGGLALEVFATNSSVDLSFPGASAGATLDRTISVEQLRAGYAESFEVAGLGGSPFSVGLGSGCSEGDLR